MKIFNQLDFAKKISNFEILEDNIKTKKYGKNSVLVQCFDIEKEQIVEICFAKGQKTENGNNSLFKIMQGYPKHSSKKNIYNIGVPIQHYFWVWKYDINSGELIEKKLTHYYEVVEILELNNKFNLVFAAKQKEKNKTSEQLKQIRQEYNKFREWFKNEHNQETNKINSTKNTNKKSNNKKVINFEYDNYQEDWPSKIIEKEPNQKRVQKLFTLIEKKSNN